MEHISNYELYGNEGFTKFKPFRCFDRINIFLFLSLVIEIIYLICILYVMNDKKNLFNELNYRQYELNDKNEKLNSQLYQAIEKNYSYNKEIEEKDNNLKVIEKYILNYNELSKELLNSNFSNNEVYIRLKEQNKERNQKINELIAMKEKYKINIKEIIDSIIIDKEIELKNIANLIENINPNEIKNKFKLCYRGENYIFNFTEAYEKCELKNNISFLIIYQTNIFKRYGAYISINAEQRSFNFEISPNGNINATKIEELDFNRKKSLIYIINQIKKYKYDSTENSLDSKIKIYDLEIFIF